MDSLVRQFLMGSSSSRLTDPYFEYTTLLLPGNGTNGAQNNTFLDSSSNNFTITRNGNTTQGTFSPFSQTGWSAYFDGTTDIVSTPTGQTNLTLGTSDFTIEGWFYIGTQVQTDPALFTSDPAIGLANTIMMQFGASNLRLALFVNNVHLTASSTNNYLLQNQWNHVAVCRTGGSTYSFYINGVAVNNVASNSTSLTTNSWRVGYWTVGGNAFAGNISNFRIIKGTALYSGATITVPTAPLTAVTNTQLLILQDNRFIDRSPNNYTLTITGDVRVTPFSPFNPTASWSAATYGGSGYFDGSGDYLTVAGNSGFAFGTGDFTIECWVNPDLINTATFDRICATSNYNGTGFDLTLNNGAAGLFLAGTSYSIFSIPIKAWGHLVYTRSGTTVRGFLNGMLSSHTTGASQDISSTATLFIAHQGHAAGGSMLTGYLADLRIIKGSIPAAYQTASTTVGTQIFTPPTAPLTAITNTSLLLNFTNAGIYDATSKNDLETVGDAQISNAITPKWGSTSIKFDGTGDSLVGINSPLRNFGTGDFTIEFWVYHSTLKNYSGLIGDRASPITTINIYTYADGKIGVTVLGSGEQFASASGIALATTWQHIALTRSSGVVNLYVGGTNRGTYSSSANMQVGNGAGLSIGSTFGTGDLNGYMQDVRVTKGYARYTSNFTPPTAAFPTL